MAYRNPPHRVDVLPNLDRLEWVSSCDGATRCDTAGYESPALRRQWSEYSK